MTKRTVIIITVLAVLSIFLLAGLTSANEAWKYVGKGIYAPLEVGLKPSLYSLPTLEDYSRVAQARTENMDKGISPDKIDLDKLLPQTKILKLDPVKKGFSPLNANNVTLKGKAGDQPGAEKQIKLSRVGELLFPDVETPLTNFSPSPDRKFYAFEEDGTVWVVEARKLSLKKAVKDKAKEQPKPVELEGALEQNKAVDWASNPLWSPDSKKFSFEANRRSSASGYNEIWISDMFKGQEKFLYSSTIPFRTLGWVLRSNILIEKWINNKPNLAMVDSKGKESPVLSEVDIAAVGNMGRKIAYTRNFATLSDKLYFMDLVSRKEKAVETPSKGFAFAKNGTFSTDDRFYATTVDNYQGKSKIFIYDLASGKTKVYALPSRDYLVDTVSWISKDLLLVNASKRGENPEAWLLQVNN